MRRYRFRVYLGLTSVMLLGTQALHAGVVVGYNAPTAVIAAGVPKYRAEPSPPDYDAIFQELVAAGITVFFPTSQYQEFPAPAALGYETDFLPPCSFNDAAFQAMRTHGIKLLVPGQLLYTPGNYPPLGNDPLANLIACAGRDLIYAVFSIDEPFGAIRNPSDPYGDVRDLYDRVKLIDPTLPVMMIHAPIPAFVENPDGSPRPVTQPEIDYYLTEVANFSLYADIIGFDVYPIPPNVASITSPYQGGAVVGYETAIPEYLQWLNGMAAGREYYLALQAFSFDDLWGQAGPPAPPTGARPPTGQELLDMACLTRSGGASQIVWWGQSFLTAEDAILWEDVKTVSGNIFFGASQACGPHGDLDGDGDVDANDFLTFSNCFDGSLNPPALGCLNFDADLDADGDVDANDFLTFSNCFNGSLNPPACP